MPNETHAVRFYGAKNAMYLLVILCVKIFNLYGFNSPQLAVININRQDAKDAKF